MKIIIYFILIILVSSSYGDKYYKFQQKDHLGDDYGYGEVTYPQNNNFRKGSFDITNFEVMQDDENLIFKIDIAAKIGKFEYPEYKYRYSLPDDFMLQLIQIYIDKDHVLGSGITATLPGINAKIAPESAWEKVIVISSLPYKFRSEIKRADLSYQDRIYLPKKIKLKNNKKTIKIKVPLREIGIPNENWGYTVLMLSHDFSGSLFKNNVLVREIKTIASQWNFGGKEENRQNTNIIDLLTPIKHPQEIVLKPDKKENIIYAVYQNQSNIKTITLKGNVLQISKNKIIVDLGAKDGILVDAEIVINNNYKAVVTEVFPEMIMAELIDNNDYKKIDKGMSVTILLK